MLSDIQKLQQIGSPQSISRFLIPWDNGFNQCWRRIRSVTQPSKAGMAGQDDELLHEPLSTQPLRAGRAATALQRPWAALAGQARVAGTEDGSSWGDMATLASTPGTAVARDTPPPAASSPSQTPPRVPRAASPLPVQPLSSPF